MFYNNKEAFQFILVILLFLAVLAFGIFVGVKQIQTEIFCFENGYKESEYILWNNSAYCMREENEYEIVVPVEEVLEREQ